MLDPGISPEHTHLFQMTPLMNASRSGSLPLVKLLLARGVRVNERDRDGRTALMVACAWGHPSIARVLIARGADVNLCAHGGATPLIQSLGRLRRVDRQQSQWVRSRYVPRLVWLLLSRGADANVSTRYGNTALTRAASLSDAAVVKMLLAHGADVNAQNVGGCSALINAANRGIDDTVRALLEHGADVSLCTPRRRLTALWFARKRGRSEIVRLLEEAGAKE